jgi:glutamate racemase
VEWAGSRWCAPCSTSYRTNRSITRNGHIGVIGTRATVASRAYEDSFAAAPHLRITTQACPEFVRFVEEGITHGPELERVARWYLEPVREAGVDTLVLGCTHYPMLTGVLSYVMGDGVTLVSSAEETAQDVYRVLAERDLMRDDRLPSPTHRFRATGDPRPFGEVGRRFLGPRIESVEDTLGFRAIVASDVDDMLLAEDVGR